MVDLIERLRAMYPFPVLCGEAADELARLRAEVESRGRSMRDLEDVLERRRTEIRELRRQVSGAKDVMAAMDRSLKSTERERDELRRRIAEAERFDAAMLLALGIPVSQDDAFAAFALVRLDADD